MKKKSNKTRSKPVLKSVLQKRFDNISALYAAEAAAREELKRGYDKEYAARINAEAECHRLEKVVDSARVIIGNMLTQLGGCFSYKPRSFSSVPLVRVKQDRVIDVATVYLGSPDTNETIDDRTRSTANLGDRI
jgi:hypothetical protein